MKIDAGDVGGPSAGLAFALDVLENSARTSTTAAGSPRPGELDLDGTRRTGRWHSSRRRSAFATPASASSSCPAGENAAEARRLCARDADRPCAQFSTGVAQPGNAVKIRCLAGGFLAPSNLQEIAAFSSSRRDLHRTDAALSIHHRGRRGPRGSRASEAEGDHGQAVANRRAQIATSGGQASALCGRRCRARPSAPTRAARSRPRSRLPLIPRRPPLARSATRSRLDSRP